MINAVNPAISNKAIRAMGGKEKLREISAKAKAEAIAQMKSGVPLEDVLKQAGQKFDAQIDFYEKKGALIEAKKSAKGKSKKAEVAETKKTKAEAKPVKAEVAEPKKTKVEAKPVKAEPKTAEVVQPKKAVKTTAKKPNASTAKPKLPKTFAKTSPLDSLAEARKSYETALKSGSLEKILEASKNLTAAQMALTSSAKPVPMVNVGTPLQSEAELALAKAQKVYDDAAKANNIDDMITAQKGVDKAKYEAGLDALKKIAGNNGNGTNLPDPPVKGGFWQTIKNHPVIAAIVVLAAATGVYLATRKDEAAIDEAA